MSPLDVLGYLRALFTVALIALMVGLILYGFGVLLRDLWRRLRRLRPPKRGE